MEIRQLQFIDSVNVWNDRLAFALFDKLHPLWEHFNQFSLFFRVYCLHDELSILGKEKEASTLTSLVVLLSLICFENLVSVVLWIKTLDDINIFNPISLSDIFENFWRITLNFYLNLNFVELCQLRLYLIRCCLSCEIFIISFICWPFLFTLSFLKLE